MVLKYYDYQDTGKDVPSGNNQPRQNHTTWETDDTTIYYIDNNLTNIKKAIDKFDSVSIIATTTYQVLIGYPDLDNDKIYLISGTDGIAQVHEIDLTNDNVNQIGSNITTTNLNTFDIFIRDGNLEFIAFRLSGGTNYISCYRWVDPNWTLVGSTAIAFSANRFTHAVIIGTDVYIIGNYLSIDHCNMLKWSGAAFSQLSQVSTTVSPRKAGTWDVQNRQGVSYDGSNLIYCTLSSGGIYYLYTYNISDDSWSKGGAYDVSLMLDRNVRGTVSPYSLEKGIGMGSDKRIYQININRQNLYQISAINAIVGNSRWITDKFMADISLNVFEYIDLSSFVYKFSRLTGYMRIPRAFMTIIDEIKISEGLFVSIKDTFTTVGSTSTEVIFEGYVEPFVEQKMQRVTLRSPANELKKLFPEGDYSGRSDEIITSLIQDYCKYITPGTLSAGQAMGQVHFNGDKELFQIFNDFSLTDNFIWALTPTGSLNYNDGTIDSTINIAETDPMSKVRRYKGARAYNEIKIKGSIAAGDQVEGDVAQNLQDQQLNGYNPFTRTISILNTNALCTTTETNILTRWGTQATLVDFFHRDISIGVIQAGQTITFQNNRTDPNISSTQFLIKLIDYNAKNQSVIYTISDRII